jgi:hypothetical protein
MNARAMAGEGLALLVEQSAEFPTRLQATLLSLMGDAAARQALCRPEPNQAVGLCLDDLAAYFG